MPITLLGVRWRRVNKILCAPHGSKASNLASIRVLDSPDLNDCADLNIRNHALFFCVWEGLKRSLSCEGGGGTASKA